MMDAITFTELWNKFLKTTPFDKRSLVTFKKTLQSLGIEFEDMYSLSSIDETQRFRFLKDNYFAPESVSLHNHPFYEFIYCTKTNGITYIVGAKQYVLQNGDLICIMPGFNHRPIFPQNMTASFDRIILHVHEKFMENLVKDILSTEITNISFDTVIRQEPAKRNQMHSLFEKGYAASSLDAEPFGKLETLSVVLQILCLILDASYNEHHEQEKFSQGDKIDLIDSVIVWIDEHYTEKVSLDKIAKDLYQSPSTIRHLFSSKMQTSFYRYVTERRLSESENLIRRGYSLEEVSRKVGFSNYQTFFRAFKNYNSISPSDYKKMSDRKNSLSYAANFPKND